MDFQRQAASLQIKHVVHLIPCHGLVHSKSWGLTCPTRTCWHACGKRMDSMTSSCVNGALCCPTRGRYWKISAEGFHDVLQNLSCPKQFRLCRQVQLFIVVFYSSPSFFFALLVSCLLSRCCQERCNPPIDGSDCQRDGRSSQDRSCSQTSLEDQEVQG